MPSQRDAARASLPARKRHAKDPPWPSLAMVEEAGGRQVAGWGWKGRSWYGSNSLGSRGLLRVQAGGQDRVPSGCTYPAPVATCRAAVRAETALRVGLVDFGGQTFRRDAWDRDTSESDGEGCRRQEHRAGNPMVHVLSAPRACVKPYRLLRARAPRNQWNCFQVV